MEPKELEQIAALMAVKLGEQVDGRVAAALAAWDATHGAGHFTPGGSDNGRKGPFANLGEQAIAVWRAYQPGVVADPRLFEIVQRAPTGMSEGVGGEGGFLLQTDVAAGLIERTYTQGQILRLVQRFPVGANSNGLKFLAVDEDQRTAGHRWGGIRGYWIAEAGTKTASSPQFREIELRLRKWAGLCYATDELLADAVALTGVLTRGFQQEMTFMVEDAVINGGGGGQPLGILTSPCLVTVPIVVGQATATVVVQNILGMWARCYGASRPNAVWLINQDVEPQLYGMEMPVGTGGIPIYMPPTGLAGAPYATLMGRPVLPCEYCQTLGTVGDIILADFSQYLMIDKGGMDQASSIHLRFVNDETAFRFVYRVDGQPAWNLPLTPANGANTQSPFVALAARP